MAIELISNVKIITSGNKPTTADLKLGELAFGKINADNKYHLYGNSDNTIGEISFTDSGGGGGTLNQIITNSDGKTNLYIEFDDNNGNITKVSPGEVLITDRDGNSVVLRSNGILSGKGDNMYPVLTADPNTVYTDTQKESFRNIINTYSKTEIDSKISNLSDTLSWEML